MPIIYLFGPDGSGKTTLARALVREFSSKRFRVKYSWMRGSHTFASIISRFLSWFNYFRGDFNLYYGIKIPRRTIMLWGFLEYLSALPIILFKYVLPSSLGWVVVADRYVLDLIVWVSLITNDTSFLRSFFGRHLISLSLSSCMFYVVADLGELIKREKGDAILLKKELDLYGSLCMNSYIIDTTWRTHEETLAELLSTLHKLGFV